MIDNLDELLLYISNSNLLIEKQEDLPMFNLVMNRKCKNGKPTKNVACFCKPANSDEWVLVDIYIRMTRTNLKRILDILDILNKEI